MLQTVLGLASRHRVNVIGPEGCSKYLPEGVMVREVSPTRNRFIVEALYASIRLVRQEKFDCIVGGSGLIAPNIAIIQTVAKIRGIVFVHGLDIIADSFIYQKIFVACLSRVNTLIANSRNTAGLLVKTGAPSERIVIVHPGTNITDNVDGGGVEGLKPGISNQDRKILLFVGRIAPRKGLYSFIDNSLDKIIAAEPATLLLVVGERPADSLVHRNDELGRITRRIKQKGLEEHVVFLGKVDDRTLSKCYSLADCLVFPLVPTAGDVEGFGMVVIEAAAHGTPTVAFAEGGVADAIDDGVSGHLVESGNYNKFTERVLTVLGQKERYRSACVEHAKAFSWSVFEEKILDVMAKVKSTRAPI